jgi:Acyl-CoA dehydrogenase, C-terminal domain
MEDSDLELFRRSVQQVTSSADGPELDAALTELGWLEAVVEDRTSAVSVVFEHLGLANNTSAALDELLALAMGVTLRPDQFVVLPPVGETMPPGEISGVRIAVRGIGSNASGPRRTAMVAVADGPSIRAVAIPLATLERRSISGLDSGLGLHEISGDVTAGDVEDLGPVNWADTVAIGQLALGHQLVGGSRVMLELARTHALERVQSGRPISSFQAVRHRLAEALVAVEAAAALLNAAWDEPTPEVAAMAKGMAGRNARTVARHAQQVLAGIGFTTEHPLHLFVRRTLVLDQLLGASTMLTRQLGTQVLTAHSLPAAFPL